MDFSKLVGQTVKTRQGAEVKILAHYPEAAPRYRLAVLHPDKRVRPHREDGTVSMRQLRTPLDLMPPTRKVRMRFISALGTSWGVPEPYWALWEDQLRRGNARWISEAVDVEVEA